MAFHTYRRWFAAAAPAEGKGFAAVDVGVTANGRGRVHDATGEIAGTVDGGNSRLHTPYHRRRRRQQNPAASGGPVTASRGAGPSCPPGEIAGTADGGNSPLQTPYHRRRRRQQTHAASGGAFTARRGAGPSCPAV